MKIKSALLGAMTKGLAVCVGEFGYKHTDGYVDEETIVKYCDQKGIGWLAWSWYGNSGGVEYLDLVSNPNGRSYTEWGDILFNKLKGMSTSKICSVYGKSNNEEGGDTETPDRGNDGNESETTEQSISFGLQGSGYFNGTFEYELNQHGIL